MRGQLKRNKDKFLEDIVLEKPRMKKKGRLNPLSKDQKTLNLIYKISDLIMTTFNKCHPGCYLN